MIAILDRAFRTKSIPVTVFVSQTTRNLMLSNTSNSLPRPSLPNNYRTASAIARKVAFWRGLTLLGKLKKTVLNRPILSGMATSFKRSFRSLVWSSSWNSQSHRQLHPIRTSAQLLFELPEWRRIKVHGQVLHRFFLTVIQSTTHFPSKVPSDLLRVPK